MISMSSWCAAIHRCVVRASAASGGPRLSGTKKSASGLWNCISQLLSWLGGESRLARSGDGLTMPFFLFIGNVKTDLFGKVRKLVCLNFAGRCENDVPAFAAHDAS